MRPCLELGNIPGANDALAVHIGKLAALRKELLPLQTGEYEQVIVKNEQLIFKRSKDGQNVYVALNLAGEEFRLDFGMDGSKVLVDRLHENEVLAPQHGTVSVVVPACSARVLQECAPEDIVKMTVPVSEQEDTASLPEAPACVQQAPAPQEHKVGRYRHFKGNEYRVIGFAKDSETMQEMVVYQALYGEQELWVRSADMFFENVQVNGMTVPRFAYLGE